MNHTEYGKRASLIGIGCNVLLCIGKLAAGYISGSISVIADGDEKTAKVVVPDYQLSLAIGKEGQNARLAARLTGFKIDIKSETQAREAGDFMDYENDYLDDEYYEEDEYYEDGEYYDDEYVDEGYDEEGYEE